MLNSYVAASFGRVYPGGAPLIDLLAVNQPLLKLIASWEAPLLPAITGLAVSGSMVCESSYTYRVLNLRSSSLKVLFGIFVESFTWRSVAGFP